MKIEKKLKIIIKNILSKGDGQMVIFDYFLSREVEINML